MGWPELIDATFPPGSVTGAPKLAALDVIAKLEPVPRGPTAAPWAGSTPTPAVGDLNVAIRTFWLDGGPAALRHGRRHHLGLDARGRVGGDRVESTTAAGGGVSVSTGGGPLVAEQGGSSHAEHRSCDEADARVSAFDHGLLTGDGVFETLKVTAGKVFAVRRHYERLLVSAGGLGLASGVPAEEVLRRAMAEVVGANSVEEGRVRITITGGPSPLGRCGTAGPTVLVAATSMKPWPPTSDVAVVPWPRNERGALAGLKTISYGENVVALAYARERGATEAVFANLAGNLCEGTGTNVFVRRRAGVPPGWSRRRCRRAAWPA